jgi:hypothetical protein
MGRCVCSNKCWWAWKKCAYLEEILSEGGYAPGMVWFADDTLENVLAVDTLLAGRVSSVHVDGAHGRGVIANQAYLDAVEPLLVPAPAPVAQEHLDHPVRAAGDGDEDSTGGNLDGAGDSMSEGSRDDLETAAAEDMEADAGDSGRRGVAEMELTPPVPAPAIALTGEER